MNNIITRNKEVKNASWIIMGRVAQMALSFVVSIATTRYLGTSNYGLISYASAYVGFFTPICTLGINSIIIKDFFDDPKNQGASIGTTIVFRVISSIFSTIIILAIIFFADKGDKETIIVAALCCVALLFQTFDTINYWFQSKYKSQVTAIATLIAYIIVCVYRIVLMIYKASIYWFAFATSVDYAVIAILLVISYFKNNGQKFRFSLIKGKYLLKNSYHYIISGMMASIYAQTDKLMLKQMLNLDEVAYYSLASTISTMWAFILSAIIDSMYPTILLLAKDSKEKFERKNRQLYGIVFYISCIVSVGFVVFGRYIITMLYGVEYEPAAKSLTIITWYVAFSYLGVARNAWIVSESKQKYLKYMYASAAVINVILNYLLIPVLKSSGAALASLITQILTSMILPLFFKDMRPNVVLMIQAVFLRDVWADKKKKDDRKHE